MGNKATGGPFAPLVVVVRNIVGDKEFNKLRGKAISLHSQGQHKQWGPRTHSSAGTDCVHLYASQVHAEGDYVHLQQFGLAAARKNKCSRCFALGDSTCSMCCLNPLPRDVFVSVA